MASVDCYVLGTAGDVSNHGVHRRVNIPVELDHAR